MKKQMNDTLIGQNSNPGIIIRDKPNGILLIQEIEFKEQKIRVEHRSIPDLIKGLLDHMGIKSGSTDPEEIAAAYAIGAATRSIKLSQQEIDELNTEARIYADGVTDLNEEFERLLDESE